MPRVCGRELLDQQLVDGVRQLQCWKIQRCCDGRLRVHQLHRGRLLPVRRLGLHRLLRWSLLYHGRRIQMFQLLDTRVDSLFGKHVRRPVRLRARVLRLGRTGHVSRVSIGHVQGKQ